MALNLYGQARHTPTILGGRFARVGLLLVAGALVASSAVASTAAAQEDDSDSSDNSAPPAAALSSANWQQTGLTGQATGSLFTPTSGAMFVQAAPPGAAVNGYRTPLMRSDDGGKTWRAAINSRDDLTGIAVDPGSQFTVYALGPHAPAPNAAGTPSPVPPQFMFKSTDDAQTFTQNYPIASTDKVLDLKPSPADSSDLYLLVGGSATNFVERSQDGGATWKSVYSIDPKQSPNCAVTTTLLYPDPTSAQRVFFGGGCYLNGDPDGQPLLQSLDGGATFNPIFQSPAQAPRLFQGGTAANPTRFYVAMSATRPGPPSDLYRSDDDGATWTSIYELQGPDTRASSPNRISAMVENPANPDQVFVAVSGPNGGVQYTSDGGASWNYVGASSETIGTVADLAVGVDGQNLYAATDQGLWVYPLSGS